MFLLAFFVVVVALLFAISGTELPATGRFYQYPLAKGWWCSGRAGQGAKSDARKGASSTVLQSNSSQ